MLHLCQRKRMKEKKKKNDPKLCSNVTVCRHPPFTTRTFSASKNSRIASHNPPADSQSELSEDAGRRSHSCCEKLYHIARIRVLSRPLPRRRQSCCWTEVPLSGSSSPGYQSWKVPLSPVSACYQPTQGHINAVRGRNTKAIGTETLLDVTTFRVHPA